MAFTAASVLNKAYILLEDTDKVRWSEATLISFINDGMKEIVKVKIDANPVYVVTDLVSGVKQTTSDNCLYLLDILYNTNAGGTTQGITPLRVKRATLDFTNPNWPQTTKIDIVKFFAYETEDNHTFYVYPPNTGAGYVIVKEAQFLDDIDDTADSIGLPIECQQALIYYVCFTAYLMDTDTSSIDKVNLYKNLFAEQMNALKVADGTEEQKNAA